MEQQTKASADFILRWTAIALLGFGLIMVASSSAPVATYKLDNTWFFAIRQSAWVLLGLIAMVIIATVKPKTIRKLVNLYFLFVIGLLVAVLIIGEERNGATSWFGLGPVGIQPTELAKIAVILGIARLAAKRRERFSDYRKGLIPSLILVGFVIALIMAQPDLGSTLIIGGAMFFMLFISGAKFKHMAMITGFLTLLMSIYLVVLAANDSYKIDRFTALVNPWSDMKGTGFQLVQSLYAFGNGGLTGVGLGESVQKLPMYLPMAYNDFIFPIIAEEFGFIGVFLFLLVFLSFLGRALLLSIRCKDLFFMLTGIGIVTMIALQAIVNIGGVTGTLPMTGVTLPFVSYGGSSILATMIGVGILLNISKQVHQEVAAESLNDASVDDGTSGNPANPIVNT